MVVAEAHDMKRGTAKSVSQYIKELKKSDPRLKKRKRRPPRTAAAAGGGGGGGKRPRGAQVLLRAKREPVAELTLYVPPAASIVSVSEDGKTVAL